MKYVAVAGTHETRRATSWTDVDSPFNQFLKSRGIEPYVSARFGQFGWSTDLDLKKHSDWPYSGWALYYYIVAEAIPPSQTIVICHSHGLQPVLYAAQYGLLIDRLISFGSPVREDMMAVARAGRANIRHWTFVHSDKSDWWQIFGSLFDGVVRLRREHPLADRNVRIPKAGHSLPTRPDLFPLLVTEQILPLAD